MGAPTRDRRLQGALEALALLAFALLLARGFRDHLDVHVFDEVLYQRQGRELLGGLLEPRLIAYSPVTTALYALLLPLPLGGWLPGDAMFLLVYAGSALALYWALRDALGGPAALAAGAWWAASPHALQFGNSALEPSVYLLGALLSALAAGLVLRRRYLAALVPFLLAAANRGDLIPWLATLGAALLFLGWRRRERRAAAAGALYGALGLALLAVNLTSWHVQKRSWLAFRQHYAVALRERAPDRVPAGEDVFRYPDPHVEASFGEAVGLGGGWRANSSEVLAHVAHNAVRVPGAAGSLATDSFAFAPRLRRALLAAAALLAGLALWRHRRRPWAVLGALDGRSWTALGTSLAVVPGILLVGAREDLLMPLLPLLLALLACPVAAGGRVLRAPPWLAPAALLALGLAAPRPFPARGPEAPAPEFRSAVAVLEAAPPGPGSRLLAVEAPALLELAGLADVDPIDPMTWEAAELPSGPPFTALLEEHRPDHVLASPRLLQLDRRYAGLREALASRAWERVAERGRAVLLRRR